MAEQQITGQHEQAIKRLRSLFEMHQIPFGAPEHLGGLLLSLHENRHFAMDFWSLVNSLSDSGSGTLGDAAMVEAVVESSTGVDANSLPADERPGIEELRQLLAGVDVSRPVEPPKKTAQPVLPASEDLMERRRSIGETLAKLEESTRELRAQLAQLDAQMSSHRTSDQIVIDPALDEIRINEEQKTESRSKWNRMSPFGEGRITAQEIDEEASQVASPRAEAAPPRRIADAQQSMITPVAAAPSPSTAQKQQRAMPAEPSVVNRPPETVPAAVFDPRPVSTLGQRGLAISDPDDDPRISAPFSKYGDDEEPSPLKRLAVPAVILVLLAAAAFAATRTGIGHVWLQRAVDSARGAYNSATGQKNETPAPVVETAPPAAQAAPSSSSAAPSSTTTAPASQPAPGNPPAGEPRRSSNTPDDEASPQREEEMVDAGVLRVPASTMAANLINSRVPAYPESARAQGIEGTVIMEVLISETGAVRYVRVIDGDRHLRAAARDAVLRWRYKPYLLNGEPIEVSTTVNLDFHLPQ